MSDFFKKLEEELIAFIESPQLEPLYNFMNKTLEQDLEDCRRVSQWLREFLKPLSEATKEFRRR